MSQFKLTSRQRKALRKASGQTRLAVERLRDDERALVQLASGAGRLSGKAQAKQGKTLIRHKRASGYVGSGKWTSFPFHHGRTFIRKAIADKASHTAL